MIDDRRAGELLAIELARADAARRSALSEGEAERHARAIARHRKNLADRLGRDAGQEVATLDYFLNINPNFAQLTLVGSATLADMQRDVMVDTLTGLFNRRFLEASLKREAARCRRQRATASLLLLDLDDFKTTNDRFGRGTGDVALQALADLICRHLRAADIPCRSGGDEFAVVLPDTDQARAQLVADRICGETQRYFADRAVAGCNLSLTVSAGVATYGGRATTAEALFGAAENALGEAKGAGGGRIVVAS